MRRCVASAEVVSGSDVRGMGESEGAALYKRKCAFPPTVVPGIRWMNHLGECEAREEGSICT